LKYSFYSNVYKQDFTPLHLFQVMPLLCPSVPSHFPKWRDTCPSVPRA